MMNEGIASRGGRNPHTFPEQLVFAQLRHEPHSALPFARDWWKSSGGCDLVPDGLVNEQDLLKFIELLQK